MANTTLRVSFTPFQKEIASLLFSFGLPPASCAIPQENTNSKNHANFFS